MEFLIAGAFFGVVCIIWAYQNRKKAFGAFHVFDRLQPWFEENHFNTDQVRFSTYDERSLVGTEGAFVLVGKGPTSTKGNVGFVAEVHPRLGIQNAHILDQSVASWHKMASVEAKTTGMTLVDALLLRQHKARKPQSAPMQPEEQAEPDRPEKEAEAVNDFLAAASFPDFTKYEAEIVWKHGDSHIVSYYQNVLPLGARLAGKSGGLRPELVPNMDHAIVVFSKEQGPVFMIAAERFDMSALGDDGINEEVPCLCLQTISGKRTNFGPSSDWLDREKFLQRTREIIGELFPLASK